MTCAVEGDQWKSLPLEMSRQGVADFKALTQSSPRQPAIYVHVEETTRRVLRIGKAERGIHLRWTTARNGHLATFEWAMGWSDRYRPYAYKFPHYVLFFRLLAGMSTEVWFLTCDKSTVKVEEEQLIAQFYPVWEKFNSLCGMQGVREGEPRGQAVSARDFTDTALPRIERLRSKRLWPSCDSGD